MLELKIESRLIEQCYLEKNPLLAKYTHLLQLKMPTKKKRLLQDLGDKNPWKNNAPSPDVARIIGQETWASNEEDPVLGYGARTIPSKEIKKVDRSDRLGEDIDLTDVVQAKLENKENIELVLEKKKSDRKKWSDVITDIDEILDDF